MPASGELSLWPILMGLAGGLALFLYGMQQLTDALKRVAGDGIKTLLGRLTTNRFRGVLAGATVTAVIQSSSVTTVLVVGFVSAGLMTLEQSIGVILGGGIGTTVTAQIVAFKVTQYSLVLITGGFLVQFLAKRDAWRQYGTMVLGIGLLFYGIQLMSESTMPLRNFAPFLDLMARMDNVFLGILVGTVFTAVIQSSAASMGIVIVLAAQGFLSVEAGIALVFGANIGTCSTALLAAIGAPREAVRTAVVHIVFKVVGVLIWLMFIDQLEVVVRWMSPSSPDLAGVARMAAETPRQIANAHTLFNVANTLIFLPFTGAFAWLVRRIVPDGPPQADDAIRPRFLDENLLGTPALALDRVRLELRRLSDRAARMVDDSLRVALDGDAHALKTLRERDGEIDDLHAAVVTYLSKLASEPLGPADSALHARYLEAATGIEHIGDLVETAVVRAGLDRVAAGVSVSAETRARLERLHARVAVAVALSFDALNSNSAERAAEVIAAKSDIQDLADGAEGKLADRIGADAPERLVLYRIESDLVEAMRRSYYFAKRIAKAQVAESGVAVGRD